jgi:geranylgeranyl reductase family protein
MREKIAGLQLSRRNCRGYRGPSSPTILAKNLMKKHTCHVLVVGAGPAGTSAAARAAREGLKVLVVERRATVGVPVRCAEYIPAPLMGELDIGRRFIVQSVRGMRTILPDGEVRETRAPGFMIRRDLFDQALADEAERRGAEVLVSTRVLSRNNRTVLVKETGGLSHVEAEVIIGGDGPHSKVGRWIGSVNQNLIPAIQVRLSLVSPMDFTEVYFHREIYGGYGWVFPKGKEVNVGVGVRKREDGGPSITDALDFFVSRLTREKKIEGRPYGLIAGWLPVEPVRNATHDNVLLAGDAAGQTNPISGAGVPQAVICGRMAGKWAARAVETGNMGLLSEYDNEWQGLYGDSLARAFERRQLLERDWDRLEEIIKYCWIAFGEYYRI